MESNSPTQKPPPLEEEAIGAYAPSPNPACRDSHDAPYLHHEPSESFLRHRKRFEDALNGRDESYMAMLRWNAMRFNPWLDSEADIMEHLKRMLAEMETPPKPVFMVPDDEPGIVLQPRLFKIYPQERPYWPGGSAYKHVTEARLGSSPRDGVMFLFGLNGGSRSDLARDEALVRFASK